MIERRNHIIALYKARLNGATPGLQITREICTSDEIFGKIDLAVMPAVADLKYIDSIP
jgi:hypothetical protein